MRSRRLGAESGLPGLLGNAVADLLESAGGPADGLVTGVRYGGDGVFHQIGCALQAPHDRLGGVLRGCIGLVRDLFGCSRLVGGAEAGQNRRGGGGDGPHDCFRVVGRQTQRTSVLAQQQHDVVAGEGGFAEPIGQLITGGRACRVRRVSLHVHLETAGGKDLTGAFESGIAGRGHQPDRRRRHGNAQIPLPLREPGSGGGRAHVIATLGEPGGSGQRIQGGKAEDGAMAMGVVAQQPAGAHKMPVDQ
jgi:hypothetical protein